LLAATDALSITGDTLTLSGSLGSAASVSTNTTGITSIQTGGVISAGASDGSGGLISVISGDNFSNAGTILGNQNITVSAQNDLNSSGTIFSNTALNLSSVAGDIDISGSATGVTGVIANGRNLDFSGTLNSDGNITLDAEQNLSINAQTTGNNIDLTANDGLLNFGANADVLASGNIIANAARVENNGIIGSNATINISAVTSSVSGLSADIISDGIISANGAITLSANDDITIAGGTIDTTANGLVSRQISGQNITLNGNQITIDGAVIGVDGVAINGASNTDAASVIVSNGAVISSSTGNVAVDLGTAGAGNRSFDAQAGSSIFAGNIVSINNVDSADLNGDATGSLGAAINAVDHISIGGSLQSDGAINLITSAAGDADNINISGQVRGGTVNIISGIVNNSGILSAAGDIDLTAANANLSNRVAAGRDLNVTVDNLTVNSGATVTAVRDLIGNASSTTTVNGILGAGNLVSLWPDQLNVGATGIIFSDGDITINAANISPIAGTIQTQDIASGDIEITSSNSIVIADGGSVLSAGGSIDINSANDINILEGGEVQAAGTNTLNGDAILIDGIVASFDRVEVNAREDGISIGATGSIDVQGNVRNIALSSTNGNGANIALNAVGAISNDGNIFTDGSIFAESQTSTIINNGQITIYLRDH